MTAELIWQQPPGWKRQSAFWLLRNIEKIQPTASTAMPVIQRQAKKKKKKLHLKAPEEPGLQKQKIPNQRQHLYCSGCGFKQTDSLDTAL